MDVKISELIALAAVILYSFATVIPDIMNAIKGKSRKEAKDSK